MNKVSFLFLFNQAYRVSRNALARTRESELFFGSSLYADLAHIDRASLGDVLAHCDNLVLKLGLLSNYGGVNVDDFITVIG